MEWRDEGIVISTRPHGETSALVELFTKQHGRHLGLVRGGRSRRLRPVLQVGNVVLATWRARLDEHLGAFAVELSEAVASRYFDEPMTLAGLGTIAGHLRLFAERERHEGLYDGARLLFSHLDDDDVWPGLLVRFELEVLTALGVGLDLSQCAATGVREELVYVSPKTGRAVCREAGAPYHDKLLRLPAFLLREGAEISKEDLLDGFRLTELFFDKHFWRAEWQSAKEGAPASRVQFLKAFHRRVLEA